MNPLLRTLGGQVAHRAARQHIGEGALLDPKRGWAMLRDRKMSPGTKVLAMALGVALTGGVVALELPLEAIVDALLPALGIVATTLFDGAEMILAPLLFASMIMPHLSAAVERRVTVAPPAPQRPLPRR